MKKNHLLLIALLVTTIVANAQMDNLSNLSAKWIRTNVRNASLDGGGDMVNFNPAGLAMIEDGIYISLSNQTLFRKPQHTFNLGTGSITSKQDGIDPFLPMVYGAWKKDKMAFLSGLYISGGGASVNYPEGSINTTMMGLKLLQALAENGYTLLKDQTLKGSSFYLTIPLNFSYSVTKNLALSVGGRYIMGENKTEAGMTFTGSVGVPDYDMTIDYQSNASGIGGVFGIDYKPCDKMNVAIHYETKVKLEFEATDNKGTYVLEADGTKSRRDLPAALNSGITYQVCEKIVAGFDFNYYFQKKADWGKVFNRTNGQILEAAEVAGDCYKLALGFRYLQSEKLELSAGCNLTAYQYDNMELYYTKMGLYEVLKYNNFNLGIGGGYNLTENIQLDLGLMRTFWKDKTINSLNGGVPVNVKSSAYVLALGLDFRF